MQRGVHSSQQSSPDTHHKTPATHDPALSDEALVQRALENGQSTEAAYSPAALRALSRTMGNQALQRWIQRALGPISQSPAPVIQRGIDDDIIAHGYDKHAVQQKEWGDPPISQDQYRAVINDALKSTENRALKNGRHAYWKDGVIVIVNSNDPSKSTCFKPTDGKSYYDKQV